MTNDERPMITTNMLFPSRRSFLAQAGGGFGALALASLLSKDRAGCGTAPSSADGPKPPHFEPRVKRVIWLFMHGGPSHVDLFDPKPDLIKLRRPAAARELRRGDDAPQGGARIRCLPPVKPFRPRGESGLEVSDFLPHIAEHADELCVIRSCHGDSVNHPQSVYQMNTGSILMGRPSVGSWVAYGLGSENRDLPAFVVLPDPGGGLKGGPPAWGSGYLPATYQGVDDAARRAADSASAAAAADQPAAAAGDARPRARAQSRPSRRARQRRRAGRPHQGLRAGVPHAVGRPGAGRSRRRDRPRRSRSTASDEKETDEFGQRCLLARRMIERGVRFVQVYSGDTNGWDAHNDVLDNHTQILPRAPTSRSPACSRDLKRRGLLERHARHLGRRVRPHADERARQRPRPQPLGLHRLARRRRRQTAASPTAPPTPSASGPRKTKSTSTTCTPRCSTSSASTPIPPSLLPQRPRRTADWADG